MGGSPSYGSTTANRVGRIGYANVPAETRKSSARITCDNTSSVHAGACGARKRKWPPNRQPFQTLNPIRLPPNQQKTIMQNIITNESEVNNATVLPFPSAAKEKPRLIIESGEMATLTEQAMQILTEAEVDIFQRGTTLVRPIVIQGVDSDGNPVRYPALLEISSAYMRLMLCQHIEWYKLDARAKKRVSPVGPGFRREDAPEEIAKAIMASAGHWPFRTIAGIISTPTLRPNGSVLNKQGYDPHTHLYLMSNVIMPPIPEKPTRADAMRALTLLKGLLVDFPFVNEASESVSLSAMISAVARNMCDVVPAHGARAPTPGTGKSYLFDIVAMILLGEKCPVISVSSDSNGETEKRIVASAMSGQQIINLDNVNGTLEGDALCQLIERPICNLRVLGFSELRRIENHAIIFFNGNNCKVVGDMTRRSILAELDARMEKPAEREFKRDPVAEVKEDRGAYIAACMTILRAYITAGKPDQNLLPMNSFGQWSAIVRSALVWLGCADPCKTIVTARDEDPVLQGIAAFIAAAKPYIPNESAALSAGDLMKLGLEANRTFEGDIIPKHPDLYAFIQGFIGRNGKPDPAGFGRWLAKYKGRPIGDEDENGKYVPMCISSKQNKKRKLDEWYVEVVNPKSSEKLY